MTAASPTIELRRDARCAYDDAVAAVRAGPATARALVQLTDLVDPDGRVLVVAAGKAARPMAAAARGLGAGFVLSSQASIENDPPLADYTCLSGGHPLPTTDGFAASERILAAVSELGRGDTLLVLLSGGASAMFEVPVADLDYADAISLYDALLRSGLAIDEINAVRGALSQTKSGRLARAAAPAAVVTLAISDVVGDDPAVIGSGPTVVPTAAAADVESLVAGLTLPDALRKTVIAALTPPPTSDPDNRRRDYRVVACATDAVAAARATLVARGFDMQDAPIDPLLGDTEDAARVFAAAIRDHVPGGGRWGMVAAGETTLRVPVQAGDGGRNRHLACRVAQLLDGVEGFALLAAGSDGLDGSPTAAGGIVDGSSAAGMRAAGVDIAGRLRDFDSGSALAQVGDDIVTGASGTNVGDLIIVVGADSA